MVTPPVKSISKRWGKVSGNLGGGGADVWDLSVSQIHADFHISHKSVFSSLFGVKPIHVAPGTLALSSRFQPPLLTVGECSSPGVPQVKKSVCTHLYYSGVG